MKTPLTISAITIVFSINAQVEKLNDLSDVLVEGSSLYVGHTPTTFSANSNVALGMTALSSITTGDFNTAIGHDALYSNLTGLNNTATGFQSLNNSISGDSNTAYGYRALFSNITGVYNTATGYHALYSNTEGDFNSASGSGALKSNTSGHYNTAFGYQALFSNTTRSQNTALGSGSQTSELNSNNQTVIGYNAKGKEDNSVVLGDSEVTAIYMAEDREAKVYAGEGNFSGQLTIGDILVSSDARLKTNIVSLGATLSKLLLIDGKTYTMKKDGKQKIGVLAQDIRKVFPELVCEDDHEMLAVNYQGLVPVLINAMKDQNNKLTERDVKLKELDLKISKLKHLIEKLIAHK